MKTMLSFGKTGLWGWLLFVQTAVADIDCPSNAYQAWNGQTLSEFKSHFKAPETVLRYTLGEALLTEFRGHLDNHFPGSEYDSLKIQEVSWRVSQWCNLTAWFYQAPPRAAWSSVEVYHWHIESEF